MGVFTAIISSKIALVSRTVLQTSRPNMTFRGMLDRSTIWAASGSNQKLNSAVRLALPGALMAPPMNTSSLIRSSGCARKARAMLVIGPIASTVVGRKLLRTVSAINSTPPAYARRLSTEAGAVRPNAPVHSSGPQRLASTCAIAALWISGSRAPARMGGRVSSRFTMRCMKSVTSLSGALPATVVMPLTSAARGLRSSIVTAAPSSPNSPVSLSIMIWSAAEPSMSESALRTGIQRRNGNQHQPGKKQNQHCRQQQANAAGGAGEFAPHQQTPQRAHHRRSLAESVAGRRAHLHFFRRGTCHEIRDRANTPDCAAGQPQQMLPQRTAKILGRLHRFALNGQQHEEEIENKRG